MVWGVKSPCDTPSAPLWGFVVLVAGLRPCALLVRQKCIFCLIYYCSVVILKIYKWDSISLRTLLCREEPYTVGGEAMENTFSKINEAELQMLEQQFTPKSEIAKYFMCSEHELDIFVKDSFGCDYQAFHDTMEARGKAVIIQKQMRLADKNPNVAIFLGKAYCGQKEDNAEIPMVRVVNDLGTTPSATQGEACSAEPSAEPSDKEK